MEYNVSLVPTTIWNHPEGMEQTVGGIVVSVEIVVGVSVGAAIVIILVGVGAKSSGIWVGEGKGVGVSGDVFDVSARESAIPPTTNRSETMAMITPPPI